MHRNLLIVTLFHTLKKGLFTFLKSIAAEIKDVVSSRTVQMQAHTGNLRAHHLRSS